MFALDFRASCFLPSSFLSYALQVPVNEFALKVAHYTKNQSSDNVVAMWLASGYLTLCGKNNIGRSNSSRFFLN